MQAPAQKLRFAWLTLLVVGTSSVCLVHELVAQQDYQAAYQGVLAQWRKQFANDKSTFANASKDAQDALQKSQEAGAILKLGAKKEDVPKLKADQEKYQKEALEHFQIALVNAPEETEANLESLNQIRYYLCNFHYRAGNYREAAAMGEYLSRKHPEDLNSIQAATIAMAASIQLYNSAKGNEKSAATDRMINIVQFIAQQWADEPAGRDAQGRLAGIALAVGDRERAMQIAKQLPEDSPQRGEIQLKLGLANWSDYLKALQKPKEQQPSKQEMASLFSETQATLQEGLDSVHRLPDLEISYTLLASELSLVQIYNMQGKFGDAIKLLERPETGLLDQVVSGKELAKPLAGSVYRDALKSYVGAKNMTKAEQMLTALASAGGSSKPGDLTKMYMALAGQLDAEVTQLRESGADDQALAGSLESLGALLEKTGARDDGHSFGSLNWVGSKLYSLAQDSDAGGGSASPQTQAAYGRAAGVFARLLSKAAKDKEFAGDASSMAYVQLKLADCQRRLGVYEQSLDNVLECVKAYPKRIQAQEAAALTYQEWGEAKNDAALLDKAAAGSHRQDDGTNLIWGWGKLAKMTRNNAKYADTFNNANYNLALCRAKSALTKDDKQKKAELAGIERELVLSYRVKPDLGGPEWKEKLNTLLMSIQRQIGKDPEGFPPLESNEKK